MQTCIQAVVIFDVGILCASSILDPYIRTQKSFLKDGWSLLKLFFDVFMSSISLAPGCSRYSVHLK